MELTEILSYCDHTLLSVTSSEEDIKRVCDEGLKYHTASVCIPPCYVRYAKDYVGSRMSVCTVVGFPNGYNSTESKIFETKKALADGADEIDMVINIGHLKSGNFSYVENEIKQIKNVCKNKILKVIIESCLLTEEEKIKMCEIITLSGADYIKTSTGFSKSGATFEDVILFKKHIGSNVKIKAAGGISSLEDAERFIMLGASRLGTSRIVNIAQSIESQN